MRTSRPLRKRDSSTSIARSAKVPKEPVEVGKAVARFVDWLGSASRAGDPRHGQGQRPGHRRRRGGDPGRRLPRDLGRWRAGRSQGFALGFRANRRSKPTVRFRRARRSASAGRSGCRSGSRRPLPPGGVGAAKKAPGACSRPSTSPAGQPSMSAASRSRTWKRRSATRRSRGASRGPAPARNSTLRKIRTNLKADKVDFVQIKALAELLAGKDLSDTSALADSYEIKLAADQLAFADIPMRARFRRCLVRRRDAHGQRSRYRRHRRRACRRHARKDRQRPDRAEGKARGAVERPVGHRLGAHHRRAVSRYRCFRAG